MTPAPELEILLPVHNEADSIRATVQEIYDQLSPQVSLRFIICEDGSKDDTKNILRELAKSIPMNLLLSDARKGYSRAVRDGMPERPEGGGDPKSICDLCRRDSKFRKLTAKRKATTNSSSTDIFQSG